MMTSRAEYRLLLRQDNADQRLTKIGYEIGLISKERYQKLLRKEDWIEAEIERLKHANVGTSKKVQDLLKDDILLISEPLRSEDFLWNRNQYLLVSSCSLLF